MVRSPEQTREAIFSRLQLCYPVHLSHRNAQNVSKAMFIGMVAVRAQPSSFGDLQRFSGISQIVSSLLDQFIDIAEGNDFDLGHKMFCQDRHARYHLKTSATCQLE